MPLATSRASATARSSPAPASVRGGRTSMISAPVTSTPHRDSTAMTCRPSGVADPSGSPVTWRDDGPDEALARTIAGTACVPIIVNARTWPVLMDIRERYGLIRLETSSFHYFHVNPAFFPVAATCPGRDEKSPRPPPSLLCRHIVGKGGRLDLIIRMIINCI
ncbi:protein of unknown function [Rhodovastum atsumiense]|nr:protein of unknown function [Rhodovastum atsumiense]